MPDPIRRVAQKYLVDPREIKIKSATTTVAAIRQAYWQVSGLHKLDALTRILEVEGGFRRRHHLRAHQDRHRRTGRQARRPRLSAAALNGDLNQQMRERVIDQLKSGGLDIVIATDVAARGIDVPRASATSSTTTSPTTPKPMSTASAAPAAPGTGNAILFVAPRKCACCAPSTRHPAAHHAADPAVAADVTNRRVAAFKDRVAGCSPPRIGVLRRHRRPARRGAERRHPRDRCRPDLPCPGSKALQIAGEDRRPRPARLGRRPQPASASSPTPTAAPGPSAISARGEDRPPREFAPRRPSRRRLNAAAPATRPTWCATASTSAGTTASQVKDIVGAIANEAGIESRFIGPHRLYDESSTVELPAGMPGEVSNLLGAPGSKAFPSTCARHRPRRRRLEKAGRRIQQVRRRQSRNGASAAKANPAQASGQ